MLSISREDYLKEVFIMNEKSEKITNKILAQRLSVSAASVSEMMKKLTQTGFVLKDAKKGYTLSSESFTEAQNLIRKHRLWEVFLVEKLGLSWADVHDDAEVLEHGTSNLLADHLNIFLGHPKYCPHGSIIYGNGGMKDLTAIKDLELNQVVTLRKVSDSSELLSYLEDKGLNLGDEMTLIKVEPFEGNFHLETQNGLVLISYKAACNLYVEESV